MKAQAMLSRFRNWTHAATMLASLLVAVLVFPAYTCQLEKTGPAEIVTPLTVDDGLPFQLLVEAVDGCTGQPIANGPTNENLVTASAIPVATTDQSELPGAPTVEYSGVQGVMSLTPITSATVLYNWQIGADGYLSETIQSMAVSRRLYRVTLQRLDGCPEPEICEEPVPCEECPPVTDCDACPACPAYPYGVSLDQCLAASLPALSEGIPLFYCCNVPAIPNDDPACSPYIYTPPAP